MTDPTNALFDRLADELDEVRQMIANGADMPAETFALSVAAEADRRLRAVYFELDIVTTRTRTLANQLTAVSRRLMSMGA